MKVYQKIVLFFKKFWLFVKTYLFCKFCKKQKKVVINNDDYVEMSDISTFDLENHNHIFKSHNPNKSHHPIQSQKTKKEYEPPKVTLVDNLDFSYHSECSNDSDDSDEFESAIQF